MKNEYISFEIAERIKFVAKQKQKTISTMLESIGLGRNAMANLKTSMPKADNIAKIADYLDCSVDYLLGRTDSPQGINQINTGDVGDNSNVNVNAPKEKACSEIDGTTLELLTAFRELSLGDKAKVMSLVAELSDK